MTDLSECFIHENWSLCCNGNWEKQKESNNRLILPNNIFRAHSPLQILCHLKSPKESAIEELYFTLDACKRLTGSPLFSIQAIHSKFVGIPGLGTLYQSLKRPYSLTISLNPWINEVETDSSHAISSFQTSSYSQILS